MKKKLLHNLSFELQIGGNSLEQKRTQQISPPVLTPNYQISNGYFTTANSFYTLKN